MDEQIHLGRVAGVRIGANWSLLVLFWLITWTLAETEFPADAPGYSRVAYWIVAATAALLFYVCLLTHELAHSILARRSGMRVEGIVLWLFGGVSQMHDEPARPDIELRMAAAGPATSLALAAAFLALGGIATGLFGAGLLAAALLWLGVINAILGVFNLAPAFPLDGGRILRAALWRRHGDKLRATAAAASAGRGFAFLLIAVGLLEFTAGGGIGGLWLVFLGWFLLAAAKSEAASSALAIQLGAMKVRAVMSADPITVPSDITIDRLLDEWVYASRYSSFPVVDDDGRLIGLVTLNRIKEVPRARRAAVRAAEIACPMDQVPTWSADDELVAVVSGIATSPDQRALVVDNERLVGIVSPSDVTRALQRAALADQPHS